MASSLQYWNGTAWVPVNSQVDLCNQSLGEGDLTVDAWGSQKVSMPYSIFHGMWTFDIPQSMWFMYHNGTQVYTSTNIISSGGGAVVTANAATPSVTLESRATPRYQPNRGHLFSTAVWMPNKTNNGIREFGLRTTENGVFFRLKADGLLYAVLKSRGVETYESVIDTSKITGFDVQKGNVYDIQYQWRGVGNYKFFINLKLVHTIANLGTLTALSMQDPALPISYKATRTTQDVAINAGCADITSENGNDDRLQYASAYAERTLNGTDLPAFVLFNPLQINGTTNTRMLELARISLNCDKKAVFKVWVTRNAAAITGATLTTIDAGSFVLTDSPQASVGAVAATSVNTALMKLVTVIPVQSNIQSVTNNPFSDRIDFPLVRGDYLVITATVSTGSCQTVTEWGEAI